MTPPASYTHIAGRQIAPLGHQRGPGDIEWTRPLDGHYVPIQYDLRDKPVWVLASCILLTATHRDTVRAQLPELMRRYRGARGLAYADQSILANHLRGGGFHNQKARRLRGMAADLIRYADHGILTDQIDRLAIESFFGCGPYAADAWELFVLRRMPDVRPLHDSVLETFAASPLCERFLTNGSIL